MAISFVGNPFCVRTITFMLGCREEFRHLIWASAVATTRAKVNCLMSCSKARRSNSHIAINERLFFSPQSDCPFFLRHCIVFACPLFTYCHVVCSSSSSIAFVVGGRFCRQLANVELDWVPNDCCTAEACLSRGRRVCLPKKSNISCVKQEILIAYSSFVISHFAHLALWALHSNLIDLLVNFFPDCLAMSVKVEGRLWVSRLLYHTAPSWEVYMKRGPPCGCAKWFSIQQGGGSIYPFWMW